MKLIDRLDVELRANYSELLQEATDALKNKSAALTTLLITLELHDMPTDAVMLNKRLIQIEQDYMELAERYDAACT